MAVTHYGSFTNNAGALNTLNLSAEAIADINNDGHLTVMLIHEDDMVSDETLLTTPSTTGSAFLVMDGGQVGMTEHSTVGVRPVVVVTYTDGSKDSIYAEGTGSYDDGAWNSNNATALTARNATSSQYLDTGNQGLVGHAYSAVFGTRYIYRLSFRFEDFDALKTVNAGYFQFRLSSDVTSGFIRYTWTGKTYVCKMDGFGSEFPASGAGLKDGFNDIENWVSSGSYLATAVTDNSIFFGTNF